MGLWVAVLATLIGTVLGMIAGFVRGADAPIMRVMDWLTDTPGILLAIALMALTRASVATVVAAISMPEIPRVVRLVRSLPLTLREQLYVEAAHAIGTRLPQMLWRHILPNVVAALIVQATIRDPSLRATTSLQRQHGLRVRPAMTRPLLCLRPRSERSAALKTLCRPQLAGLVVLVHSRDACGSTTQGCLEATKI